MKDTIKVFSFCASLRGSRSFTAGFAGRVCGKIRQLAAERGIGTEYEILTGSDVRVDYCRGCESCFRGGSCPLDGQDGLAAVKRKMLDCDVLLFGSPVYTGSMSGLAKSVLDRLGYWTHRFELAGKPTAVLVTTSNNHGPETAEEIRSDFSAMGAAVVYAGAAARHSGRPNLHLPDDMDPLTDRIAGDLLDCLRDPVPYIREEQEALFRYLRKLYSRENAVAGILGREPGKETAVFYARGMNGCRSLSEYVAGIREADGTT